MSNITKFENNSRKGTTSHVVKSIMIKADEKGWDKDKACREIARRAFKGEGLSSENAEKKARQWYSFMATRDLAPGQTRRSQAAAQSLAA